MAATAAALLVAACGFTPVYAPGGTGSALYGAVTVQAPETLGANEDSDAYFLVQNLETRLGRSAAGDYGLDLKLRTRSEGQAITADNEITRYSIVGEAAYVLTRKSDGAIVASGDVENFTGYSATGTTVETLAGERDAHRRLMVILADQITTELLSTANLTAGQATAVQTVPVSE
ncbi:putative secreted (periplasmic) protein [Phaeobacter porticola]|uniref:Putative secreted (Periplasmic) protein n=2 Tax=Phaeobacter porticola TaxID=1844006 RepID=A0A1L3I917_9RHOB|nr:putative secreted (periplasmic) protein [Phaeobacter porticola]